MPWRCLGSWRLPQVRPSWLSAGRQRGAEARGWRRLTRFLNVARGLTFGAWCCCRLPETVERVCTPVPCHVDDMPSCSDGPRCRAAPASDHHCYGERDPRECQREVGDLRHRHRLQRGCDCALEGE